MKGVRFLPLFLSFILVFSGYGEIETDEATLNGRILYVGGTGPNNYTKIQDAINDAKDGYLIYVYPGYYNESIVINKSISLIGIGEEKPVIVGGGNRSAVKIIADGCLLKNFIVKSNKSIHSPPAIEVISDDNVIENNAFIYGWTAACFKNYSNNVVKNNLFMHGYYYGVYTENGKNNQFINNIAERNGLEGFSFNEIDSSIVNNIATKNIHGMGIWCCKNCEIISNLFYSNHEYGIHIVESVNVSLLNNSIYGHPYGGILLMDCTNCTIERNDVHNNYWGIMVEGTYRIPWCKNKNNVIKRNNIYSNSIGIYLDKGRNNYFIENNLMNNDINAYFELLINVQDPNPIRPLYNLWLRNYWDDWKLSLPKPIKGRLWIDIRFLFFNTPWFYFDKNPALEPWGI